MSIFPEPLWASHGQWLQYLVCSRCSMYALRMDGWMDEWVDDERRERKGTTLEVIWNHLI